MTQGYTDIAYSFLIGGDGLIYEGRGWNKRTGANAPKNSVSYSVSFIGNFVNDYPPQNMMAAYERLQAVSSFSVLYSRNRI